MSTQADTVKRRELIYKLLGFGEEAQKHLDTTYPRDPGAIVIEGTGGAWKPWYTTERQSERSFYSKAYTNVLVADPGWDSQGIGRLDAASTAVLRRLADPSWPESYQSKGLVVGFVQSGKTANFTGVIAKAIDAGYRLIIVLTGTVEILRRQTQRRLDMELVGVENILGGIDEHDEEQVARTDYYNDQDWRAGKFLRHGVPIHTIDSIPLVHRLSTFEGDYRRLRQGLSTLDFRAGRELVDRNRPLYDPINLFQSDVRLAVVKKNSTVLARLVDDLKEIRADLGEIPTLIIDDEADQASVNTKKQKSKTDEEKERSAINRRISDMLRVLKRAQYVGYTATPFANVFIDPDDSEDIFPKDFIVSLERPAGYMGARDFYDLEVDFAGQPKSIDNSNEKAFVRDLIAVNDPKRRREEIQSALDSFVLTGALKLFRSKETGQRFRHHTMLVHESVKQKEHETLRDEILDIWRKSNYDSAIGVERLRGLFNKDFAPVAAALHRRDVATAHSQSRPLPKKPPMPESFERLIAEGWIGSALDRIDRGTSVVIVVNGAAEKDYAQDSLNFEADDVWKILVGGTKLSRGFTVEGLTVSYYTRRTLQADTLMQMGRWFGFRRGYRDLVRLYIGRNVPAPGGKHVDLYEAFGAVVRDEEDFRAELERYANVTDTGHPQVRPEDIPPMVFQQVPWLKPTASSKMYNAELVRQGIGGQLVDFPLQPDRDGGRNNDMHFSAVQPILDLIQERGRFEYLDPGTGKISSYHGRYGIVPASTVRDAVAKFKWAPNWSFAPNLAFVDDIIKRGELQDFAVLLPDLEGVATRRIGQRPEELPIMRRRRRTDRPGFSGSSKRQRDAIETIAGKRIPIQGVDQLDESGGALAVQLHTQTRAAMLLTFALDTKDPDAEPARLPAEAVSPTDVATIFSWALPYAAAPGGRIGFRTRKSGGGAIIDRTDGDS
ncbi:Z1 domain-containing protein [Mycobacterium colombiense]|uniref:Z1 domain-containing protein n=1 Tax=Mycobacterium colombiense TaxID=339268 RepID=UPI001E613244|nr:Z1 domain-containing protein [Mycobacterium colombiense]